MDIRKFKCQFCGCLILSICLLETCPNCHGGTLREEKDQPHLPDSEYLGRYENIPGIYLRGLSESVTITTAEIDNIEIDKDGRCLKIYFPKNP